MIALPTKRAIRILDLTMKIMDRSFLEGDILLLMYELRETARELRKLSSTPEVISSWLDAFIEAADSIAHSKRDRYDIERRLRLQAELLLTMVDAPVRQLMSTPNSAAINIDLVVHGMEVCVLAALQPVVFENQDVEKIQGAFFEGKNELAMCLLSILQEVRVDLQKASGSAVLHLNTHKGRVRLYCTILDSNFHKELNSRYSESRVFLGFPLYFSSVIDLNVIPTISSGFLIESEDTKDSPFVPIIFRTFRDEAGRLRFLRL